MACIAVWIAAGCAPKETTIDRVAEVLPGRWECPDLGELVMFDLGHYLLVERSQWGHFLIDFDGEITFRDDGPLRGRAGRVDPESENVEIGPLDDAHACGRLDAPLPSLVPPDHR